MTKCPELYVQGSICCFITLDNFFLFSEIDEVVIVLNLALSTISCPHDAPASYLRLGQLIVMVWELEVHAACVDVKALSQDGGGHDGALNVPAWSPLPPGRVPGGLPGLGCLPQCKVTAAPLLLQTVI